MNAKINTRKIKARRVELDIKQKQMSEMLKCSTVTYSKKERGILKARNYLWFLRY